MKDYSLNIEEKINKRSEVENLEKQSDKNITYTNNSNNSQVHYDAVLKDKLTPTINAYYYSQRGYIQSDKEAANLKQIKNINNNMNMLDGENNEKREVG